MKPFYPSIKINPTSNSTSPRKSPVLQGIELPPVQITLTKTHPNSPRVPKKHTSHISHHHLLQMSDQPTTSQTPFHSLPSLPTRFTRSPLLGPGHRCLPSRLPNLAASAAPQRPQVSRPGAASAAEPLRVDSVDPVGY